jgi:predicted ATPase/DNA-binding SARP family transcriptional activator
VPPVRSDQRAVTTHSAAVALLGPLDVRVDSTEVTISGSLLRLLLLRLAIEAPRAVSAAALVDAVWSGEPPEEPVNALQSLISRLRRCLGHAGSVSGGPGGYRLTVPGLALDSDRFMRLAADGRRDLHEGRAELAAATLREALDLWRGDALAEAGDADWARSTRRSLQARRIDALLDRIDADSALGRHAALAGELAALDLQYPLDERFAARLVNALAADGRTATALAAYEQFRSRLADALGADPSPAMQARHLALLRGGSTAAPAAPARRPDTGAVPLPLTTFVGREADLDGVRTLLAAGRLVTIVGTGGCGKTRLATEVTGTLAGARPGGPGVDAGPVPEIRLVQLAPVTAGGEVPAVVLSALGMNEGRSVDRHGALVRSTDPTRRILDVLADRDVLLVVDNCEHLLGPVAELTEQILGNCPRVRVLATSREPLSLTGEALWPLSPLRTPAPQATPAGPTDPMVAAGYPAVELFCDRARAARPGFVLDETTAADITEIVRRLDGLPLAIELAAARFRTLPLPQIASGLSDRFRLLTGGSRTALPRHRTLRAVVGWSWELLSESERALAEAVSVFAGGVTAAGAHAACPAVGTEADVAELLGSLVDKSLLTLAPGVGARYRMLETLREFGIERLSAQGRLAAAYDAHARFFADLAERAEPHLLTADQLRWIRGLVAERENLAAAIRHLGSSGAAARAVTTVARLAWFWLAADWHTDFDAAITVALEAADARAARVAAGTSAAAGTCAAAGGTPDPVELLCLRGLSIANAAALPRPDGPGGRDGLVTARGELHGIADCLFALLDGPLPIGNWPRSLAVVVASVLTALADPAAHTPERFERMLRDPIPWVAAMGHVVTAAFAENAGDVASMRLHARLGVSALRPIGERWALHGALRIAGQACVYEGDLDGAVNAFTEALRHGTELAAEFGTSGEDVFIELQLARVLHSLGDVDAALAHARAAAGSTASLPDLRGIATDALLLQLLQSTGTTGEVAEIRARMTGRLADRVPGGGPFGGHETALALTIAASIALDDGELDVAADQLAEAFDAAVRTTDQPVVASVGVTVARLLQARGEPVLAARAVGAAAVVRGAPDRTDPYLIRVLAQLGETVGPDELDRLTIFTGDRAAAVEFLRSAVAARGAAE